MSDSTTKNPSLLALPQNMQRTVADECAHADRVQRRLAFHLTKHVPDADTAHGAEPAETAQSRRSNLDAELLALRDQIAESRAEDLPPLIEHMMRLAALANVDNPASQKITVDANSPYFGHLRLNEDGRVRDVFIGKGSFIDSSHNIAVVDWRQAPISRLYYCYNEDDEYSENIAGRKKEGFIEVKRTVSFYKGRVSRIRSGDDTAVLRNRQGTEQWETLDMPAPVLRGGAGVAERAPAPDRRQKPPQNPVARAAQQQAQQRVQQAQPTLGHTFGHADVELRADKHLPEIAALIDTAQFRAMTADATGIVVLHGGAGSGKTTVALHRVAYLSFRSPERFRASHILVVVPQMHLVRYISRILPSLDVGNVKVQCYSDWIKDRINALLPNDQRRRVVDLVPESASRLKKHPQMQAAIEAQIQRHIQFCSKKISDLANNADISAIEYQKIQKIWDDSSKQQFLAIRLERFIQDVQQAYLSYPAQERAKNIAERTLRQALDVVDEWEELITDTDLLAPCLADLHPQERSEALAYTKLQITEIEDESDIDPEMRTPVDGYNDDINDPTHAFDRLDFALLLAMWRIRTGRISSRNGPPLTYDHIAIDEAQDLSAVEMRPLLWAAGPVPSMTLAGDTVQKLVFDNGFSDWPELMQQLGTVATAAPLLALSYRSTAEVVEFAGEVLGPLAPAVPPRPVRSGAPVEAFLFDDIGEEIAFLAEALRLLMLREPNASVALIARFPEQASFYYNHLERSDVPSIRLVNDGDFRFTPGIDVVPAHRVKGLEFDYVILLDASSASYPDTPAARHLLHITATRAAHQLWITAPRTAPSPLLPKHLIEVYL